MSQRYGHQVGFIFQRSLRECTCSCRHSRSLNPPNVAHGRPITSKTSNNNDLAIKDTNKTLRTSLQEKLKHLRTLAGSRLQDTLQDSREIFLSRLYPLQIQSDKKDEKSDDSNGEAFGKSVRDRADSSTYVTSGSLEEKEAVSSRKELQRNDQKSDDPLRDETILSLPAEDQPKRSDFWINIPSFRIGIDRMKAPLQRGNSTASTTRETQPAEMRTTVVKNHRGVVRILEDELKPDSIEVTAEGEPKESLGIGNAGKPTYPSSRFLAKADRPESLPGLEDRSKDVDDFNLESSPILNMNVALLEMRNGARLGEGDERIRAAKETDVGMKVRRNLRAENQELASKKVKKQMKPVISKTFVDDRTRNLAVGFCNATSISSRLLKLEKLDAHLIAYPESREVALKVKLIPSLLKHRSTWDDALRGQINETLAILGYAGPVKGRGIRILSVDGGGTRGVIAIETLRQIERRTKRPIRDMFDYIVGVSSGAVLCFLLAFEGASLDECEELYKELSQEVFKRNTFLGTSKLFLNHAFYDTEGWIKILKAHALGDTPMISTARDASCPKVGAVGTVMNIGYIKDFMFRNYNLPPGVQSHYRGSCKYYLWQAARASSAAPGYFEECKLDDYVFQDGGVLTNNPCALAIHECRLLWPDTPIQSVVSVGCGRYDPTMEGQVEPEYSSLKKKLTNIMVSATDTESVHTVLQDLLPSGAYFRFNPRITEDFFLDENRPAKIAQMQQEARDYLDFNELKLEQATGVLGRERRPLQKLGDWLELQRQLRR